MNAVDFCFWLQGYFEISGTKEMTPAQLEVVKNHLSLVFKHEIDPLRESETPTPAKVLNQAHSGRPPGGGLGNDVLARC